MRISELSRAATVPLPTVKFYLREGLLPPGRRTAPNQATYDDAHVERLRLIRALHEVGRLDLGTIRRVCAALDDPLRSDHHLLGIAHHALGPPPGAPDSPELDDAMAEVDGLLSELGWHVHSSAPSRRALAEALVALHRLGRPADTSSLAFYATVADGLAEWELARAEPGSSRARLVESAVIGTVLYEAVLVALRRLAQEHHSARRHSSLR